MHTRNNETLVTYQSSQRTRARTNASAEESLAGKTYGIELLRTPKPDLSNRCRSESAAGQVRAPSVTEAVRSAIDGANVSSSRFGPRTASEDPKSMRSEEHTSELQSHLNLVSRLLLEKK